MKRGGIIQWVNRFNYGNPIMRKNLVKLLESVDEVKNTLNKKGK